MRCVKDGNDQSEHSIVYELIYFFGIQKLKNVFMDKQVIVISMDVLGKMRLM